MAKSTMEKESQTKVKSSRLFRSEKDRIVAGVCSGLGEFFQVDVTIVRLIFVMLTLFGGGGILLYLILWLLIPSDSSESQINKADIENNANEIKDKARNIARDIKLNSSNFNTRQIVGMSILVFGGFLLLEEFGLVNIRHLFKFIPAIIIIIVGYAILRKHN